jgi:hypothetical protein
MSNVFQPSSQATTSQQQQREHIAKHLIVDGKAPDAAMIERIISAKPKVTSRNSNLQTRGFSLMR